MQSFHLGNLKSGEEIKRLIMSTSGHSRVPNFQNKYIILIPFIIFFENFNFFLFIFFPSPSYPIPLPSSNLQIFS